MKLLTMKLNPIYKKDVMVSNRSYLLPLLILGINAVFAILVLINLYSISINAAETGEIRYADFLKVYQALSLVELALISLLSPALTSSSITGERERHTLGILLSTQLSTTDIIVGKLMGALSMIFVLIISTLPVMTTAFIFGGITFETAALLVFSFFTTAFYSASIGIMSSSFQRSTVIATATAYAVVFVSEGITMLLWYYHSFLNLSFVIICFITNIIMLLLGALMIYLSERRLLLRRG